MPNNNHPDPRIFRIQTMGLPQCHYKTLLDQISYGAVIKEFNLYHASIVPILVFLPCTILLLIY